MTTSPSLIHHILLFAAVALAGRVASAQVTVTNDFNTSRDYTSGTGGDSFFSGQQFNGGLQGGGATLYQANANTSNPGQLTISSAGGRWQGGDDNGFLLYRNVTGDFSAKVQLTSVTSANYDTAGLMARNANLSNGENWIGAQLFPEYGGGPSQRNTVNSGADDTFSGTNYASGYLELIRSGSVFTTLYSSDGVNFTQIGQATRTDLPATLQVGLYEASFTGNVGTATFDNFSISQVPEPSTWAGGLGCVGLLGLSLRRQARRFFKPPFAVAASR